VHTLDWLPYDYWIDGTNRYELFRTEPGINQDIEIYETSTKSLFHRDQKLNYDNGIYNYTAVAYESTTGFNQKSVSNTIDLIQAPILYAPNAYTENGDELNDTFLPVTAFVKDYHLQIYNRWGEKIFESYDKKQGFNSQFKGIEVKSDVYFYLVNYSGWDGSFHTKKGNFTLLR
jgi:gliding motility-associated-like protein